MIARVAVFIDYQNAYMGARSAFDHSLGHIHGQFHPGHLGVELVRAGRTRRALAGVYVYRGLPSSTLDPRGHAATRSQVSQWGMDPHVHSILRPLMYRPGMRPQEKGIDVALAIDFVTMALRDEYDVGILFSTDTDMKPALEAVLELAPRKRVEVAAWRGPSGRSPRLSLPQRNLWCHWLGTSTYDDVKDLRDYSRR